MMTTRQGKLLIGTVAVAFTVFVFIWWWWWRKNRQTATTKVKLTDDDGIILNGASAIETTRGSHGVAFHAPDAGGAPEYWPDGTPTHASMNLPTSLQGDNGTLLPDGVAKQWAAYEQSYQQNTGVDGSGTGEFWPHGWTTLGPIDPLTPRAPNKNGESTVVVPGPTDPQLVYGMSMAAALDGQTKFCVMENPNDITYQYRNQLQQLPGSHFAVDAASFDAHKTPQVVDRFAALPREAAAWVIGQLNAKMRAEHPCFSLAGREHFELSNPPMQCGDGTNVKQDPITLIRIFESRIKKDDATNHQLIYLTMEIGNAISTGSGGMFSTIVTMDAYGKFIDYTRVERDQKHTFVLPRTR